MAIINGLIPVFVLLLVGVLARWLGLLNHQAASGLNRVVANLALPALLLAKVGTAPLDVTFSPRLIVITCGLTVLIWLIGLALATGWQLPKNQRGVLAQAGLRGNIAYVSFPIILNTYGDDGLRLAAVTSALLIPTMNLISAAGLEMNRSAHKNVGRMLLRVVANPLVSATLVGLVLAAMHWKPWGWLAGTLKILGDFALPGALLALGAQLEVGKLRNVWRITAVATALKLVALPAAGFWLLRTMGCSPLEQAVGLLMLASPTAVTSYAVAADLDGDTDLAGACLLATTALAFPAYFLWSILLT